MLCNHARNCLQHLHKQSKRLHRKPEMSGEILSRLKLLLPVGIIFKEQRQRLHNIAEHIHNSHATHRTINPNAQVPKLLGEVRYRLHQLNRLASEQENRIHNLHQVADNYAVAHHYSKMHHCIRAAIKLQHLNHKLLKGLHKTERHFARLLRKAKIRYGLNIATV